MAHYSLSLLVFLSFPIFSETVLVPGKPYLWKGAKILVPTKSVMVEENDKIRIFPKEKEPFFLVLRSLPKGKKLDWEEWNTKGIWKDLDVRTSVEETVLGSCKIRKAKQVRSYHEIQTEVWFCTRQEEGYWIWLSYELDDQDLGSFFERRRFLEGN